MNITGVLGLHEFPSKRLFRSGKHSLHRRTDAMLSVLFDAIAALVSNSNFTLHAIPRIDYLIPTDNVRVLVSH